MVHHSPTLPDLMAVLSKLHPRHLVSTRVTTVKQLRLVSREVSRMALDSVTTCEFGLGEGSPSPSPQELVELLSKTQLQQVKVKLTTKTAATVEQQLSACTSQMNTLLAGMSTAMSSVTKLTLTVVHHEDTASHADQSHASTAHQQLNEGTVASSEHRYPLPHEFGAVSGAVFAMLAAAVPKLTKLCLSGSCWDAALPAFGASCPQFANLQLLDTAVQASALHDLGRSLPNLRTVTFSGACTLDQSTAKRQQIGAFMDVLLSSLHDCNNLTTLKLIGSDSPHITCTPASWSLLPASLTELWCDCYVTSSAPFELLIRRLKVLFVHRAPPGCEGLLQLLHQFPCLEKFKILSSDEFFITCVPDTLLFGHQSLVKQRMLGGNFLLECDNLVFSGTCKQVRDMFAWLPQLTHVDHLSIDFSGGALEKCLEQLPYVFPDVETFRLEGRLAQSDVKGMDAQFFAPLAALPILSTLLLTCKRLSLTTHGLATLCKSLPELSELVLRSGTDKVKQALVDRLARFGLDIVIEYEEED